MRGTAPLQALSVLALIAAASLAAADAERAGQTANEEQKQEAPAKVLAPGWAPLEDPAPTPGTYDLPPLGSAADGPVLDTAGRPRHLFDFFGDKIVVLSFVYRSCSDVNGCPLANYVFTGIQRRILEDPALRNHARLVSMSFDPVRDTPDAIRRYAAGLVADGADWTFLTTESERTLTPILRAYGQSVNREYDANGKPLGTISHILRVYLIDRTKRIRNIYSSSFLHADTVTSDIKTLLLEEARGDADGETGGPAHDRFTDPHAGDDKRGYERDDDATHSKSLDADAPANALQLPLQPPLGLPQVPVPDDNPITPEKVALGRKLFFDRRLSHNDTMSCAMCHVPEQGFTNNEMATAVGIEGQTERRNAPTIYNVAFLERLFYDGRESRLEQQIWAPLLAHNEMGNPSVGYVLDKIHGLDDYADLFGTAFPGRGESMDTLGMALASYERTVLSADSPFDRWYFGKQENALSASAVRGFGLFTGKAKCASCHTIGSDHALFTDQQFHDTGIGYRQTMSPSGDGGKVEVAPGTFLALDPAAVGSAAEARPTDLGRYEITQDPSDRWKYRTPSLRNVALTAPYMHDGSLRTLREVVEFYNGGGVAHELLDPRLKPLGLGAPERGDLIAFLESLTGDAAPRATE